MRVPSGGPLGARGFTLVETAVTIAVIGVIAAIAGPSLTRLVPRARLDNSTAILVNEIALARRLAIAQSVDYSIAFDTAGESYTLRRRAGGGWEVLGANRFSATDIVSLTGFSTTDTLVVLAGGAVNVPPTAGGSANFGYITLRTPGGERTRRIRVEPLGRVVAER